jgi:hypothetical protein
MTSTHEGMNIDDSDEQVPNAVRWICESLEPDSKATTESNEQPSKQHSDTTSIEDGKQTNLIRPAWTSGVLFRVKLLTLKIQPPIQTELRPKHRATF